MASIVSINVGLPQDVDWNGKAVHTAIWKRPVSGRVMARRLNIDGDGQGDLAGHGGEHRAVMVYELDSYRYWSNLLNRNDFEYGQFGENLTVEGLSDEAVCVGDRYSIGDALFEVTQPRVTCYRVGLRMNNPNMPSLLVSHKRPGFYCRVIQEGLIGAGDEIKKVSDGPGAVSIAEMGGLLYLPEPTRDGLERALRIPALSQGWQDSLRAILEAEQAGNSVGNAGLAPTVSAPPVWPGLRPLKVTAIVRETEEVLSFAFGAIDGSPLPECIAGQFLALRFKPAGASSPLIRNYSISGPTGAGTYRISVKRTGGTGSRYLHDEVRLGDTLDVSAPRGGFKLTAGESPVVFLSAGIGITPVLSMLYSLASSVPASSRSVWWCHGARNGREHAFAGEVRGLLARLGNHHSFVAFSRPEHSDTVGRDYDVTGHLQLSMLKSGGLPAEADFFLCGPTGFTYDLADALTAWGVPKARIHSETFGTQTALTPGMSGRAATTPHVPAGPAGIGPEVSFARSSLTVPWNSQCSSLLEFAESCGVPVRWSCRSGVCHVCESGLVDGQVRYAPNPLDPPLEGNVLICCAIPTTAIALDL